LSCQSVAVVRTLVQTKQIRINIHNGNHPQYTAQAIQTTVNTSTHITKTPTHTHTHAIAKQVKML
jgi:ribosomal protein L31